jgi:hypothetical protein
MDSSLGVPSFYPHSRNLGLLRTIFAALKASKDVVFYGKTHKTSIFSYIHNNTNKIRVVYYVITKYD